MHVIVEQLVPIVIMAVWGGGVVVLYLRFRAKQREYLGKFPPVGGISLDTYYGGNPFGPVLHEINQVMREKQRDPELESLRIDMWRRYRFIVIWGVAFPLLSFGILAFLIAVGLAH